MKECAVDGCSNRVKAKGLCNRHWYRWKRHGSPTLGGVDRDAAPSFFITKVLPFNEESCLYWPYGRTSSGYGRATIDGVRVVVSREACRRVHGEPPSADYDAAHSCGNGHLGCVNPMHLSWKTRAQNHADKLVHGTDARGEKCPTSKITNDTAREIKALIAQGVRNVDICKRTGATRSIVEHIKAGNSWNWL